MKLHKDECEFSIVWNMSDKNAVISITSPSNFSKYKELKQLAQDYPDVYRIQMERVHEDWSFLSVECPKNLAIHLSKPRDKRELTDEQREELVQRAKFMQQKRKTINK